MPSCNSFREEKDLLGLGYVPKNAYYGIQTKRAIENFPLTGVSIGHYPHFVCALAMVKEACAKANKELGLLDETRANAISRACKDIQRGMLHDQFKVDMIQGGAGTSTNMNANEVIANRALEILGKEKGYYSLLHPNNHVNMSQSTNDAYPSAVKLAILLGLRSVVAETIDIVRSFKRKGEKFSDVIKMGRTQLQDAVPMFLGQEFNAFSTTLQEDIERFNELSALLMEINLGGTAIGTGINAHPEFGERAVTALSEISEYPFQLSANLVEATSDTGVFVIFSSMLKRSALKLSKICNDLRLLSSGPRTGINEINLPPVQPGSSIMPGKVNPVIPEAVNQVAYEVVGNDLSVTLAADAGQLQLNVMEPLIVYKVLQSQTYIAKAMSMLRTKCIDGITANEQICKHYVNSSIGVVTALNPHIGYEKASQIAQSALDTGQSVTELVLKEGLLEQSDLDEILSAKNMVR